MTAMTPDPSSRRAKFSWRVRWAYWRQFIWFYLWKWSMPISWLHIATIGPVNHARQRYVELWRKENR